MPDKRDEIRFEEYQRDNSSVTYASLDEVLEWVQENIEPDDLYDNEKIRKCAMSISSPEDVFSDKQLGEWAEENGYVKSDQP